MGLSCVFFFFSIVVFKHIMEELYIFLGWEIEATVAPAYNGKYLKEGFSYLLQILQEAFKQVLQHISLWLYE